MRNKQYLSEVLNDLHYGLYLFDDVKNEEPFPSVLSNFVNSLDFELGDNFWRIFRVDHKTI